jgi:hypothetical protein
MDGAIRHRSEQRGSKPIDLLMLSASIAAVLWIVVSY